MGSMAAIWLLMMSITAREEIVAPVIMSTSVSPPAPLPGFTPTMGAPTPSNSPTKTLSFTILSPSPGVSLLSSTSSSPSLKQPILDAIRDVPYPGTDGSIYDWWADRADDGQPTMGNLGGGSDHVAFYTHAGVPSAGLGSGGRSGIYHSNYDNFAWFERFGDPEWVYGPMIATADGLLALRFGNADLLPYDVVRYAVDTRTHVNTLLEVAEARRVQVELSRLVEATTGLEEAALALDEARSRRVEAGPVAPNAAAEINAALIGLEKAWLDDRGLQDREWSRSLYVSPDPFSGYASWMLPGIRYEIETDDPAQVPEWEGRYLDAIQRLTDWMNEVTELIEGS